MRNRENLEAKFREAYRTDGPHDLPPQNSFPPKYAHDQHTRKEMVDTIQTEILLDIRDLLDAIRERMNLV